MLDLISEKSNSNSDEELSTDINNVLSLRILDNSSFVPNLSIGGSNGGRWQQISF